MNTHDTIKKVFLIHGFDGTPNGGWRSYVMKGLSERDIYAASLSMPTPGNPQLNEWLEELHRHVIRNQNDDVYLIGHSLGGTAILRYIETYEASNVRGIISVSAPCHQNTNEKIQNFLLQDFDWAKIKNKVPHVVVVHGDNDQVVPVSDAQEIARELGGKLILIPNGKHLNGSAGFTELPEVLEEIVAMVG